MSSRRLTISALTLLVVSVGFLPSLHGQLSSGNILVVLSTNPDPPVFDIRTDLSIEIRDKNTQKLLNNVDYKIEIKNPTGSTIRTFEDITANGIISKAFIFASAGKHSVIIKVNSVGGQQATADLVIFPLDVLTGFKGTSVLTTKNVRTLSQGFTPKTNFARDEIVLISATLENNKPSEQIFNFIAQVKDEAGRIVAPPNFQSKTLQKGEIGDVTISAKLSLQGTYVAEIFAWDSLLNADPLMKSKTIQFTVG